MKDNLKNVKELSLQALSDSIAVHNRCPTEDLKSRIQVERSLNNINRLVLGKVMKLQPSCE